MFRALCSIVLIIGRFPICKLEVQGCPSGCKCSVEQIVGKFSVSCGTIALSSRSAYSSFPTVLPTNTQVFLFRVTEEAQIFDETVISFTDISWLHVEEITLQRVRYLQLNQTRLHGLSRLKVLRLKDETLTQIAHRDTFLSTPKVEVLDLIYNTQLSLKSVVSALNDSLPNLKYLDLCNLQAALSEPFTLTKEFAVAIQNKRKHLYTCKFDNSLNYMTSNLLNDMNYHCNRKEFLGAIIAIPCIIILIIVFSYVIVRRHRNIKRKAIRSDTLMERYNMNKCEDRQRYFVFLSFAGRDYELVQTYIIPELKKFVKETFGNNDNLICTRDSHFTPGRWITEEMDRCLNKCDVFVMVVTKHFIKSEWCKYEEMVAKQKSKFKILLVNEEDYQQKIPSALREILKVCTRATQRLQNHTIVIRP
ncbi:hypothetical protein CHS0354_023128 [Potamilus streckersoni]|uniref:TIR domain-containing protein n=1 Tax=Potamilus streckersoni TaxID=2493646 RepID=A0AAE0RNX1_9BIVA|nr:hypothetical protein CHS0354_023128 [Potamilus streckersoni]